MLSEASRQALKRVLWFGLALHALVMVMVLPFWVWAQLPADAMVPTHYWLNDPDAGAGQHHQPARLE